MYAATSDNLQLQTAEMPDSGADAIDQRDYRDHAGEGFALIL
jgi:hypothetical protein